jgi:hypothetical protein
VSKGKPCSICADKNRCKIDEWYVKTADIRGTARKFRVSEDALGRHISKGHISKVIQAAVNDSEKERGLNLQACAQEIYDLCLSGAKKAEKQDLRALGSCLGPAVKVLELLNTGKPDGDDKPGIDRAMERMKHDRDTRRANL